MKSKITILVFLGLFLISSLFNAQTIEQVSTSSGAPNYSQNYAFNQFDPALGTLNSVEVKLAITTTGGVGVIDNDGAGVATGSAEFGSLGQILSPAHLFPLLGQVKSGTAVAGITLQPDDGDAGTFSATGTDAITINGGVVHVSNSGFVGVGDRPSYIGTGTININLQVQAYLDFTIAGGPQTQTSPPAAIDSVIVIYSYTPTSLDLGITKVASSSTPDLGTNFTYTIQLTNNTALTGATNIKVTDNLPAQVTYVSHTATEGTFNNLTGIWDLGSYILMGGSTETLVITVTGNSTGAIPNTATITDVDQTDTNPANNSATALVTITAPDADIRLDKSVDITHPDLGDAIQFTISVTNDGPDLATGVEVSDLLPAGLTHTGNTPSKGTYTPGTGLWVVGSIPNGITETLLINATVSGTGLIANIAEVMDMDQNDPDSDPGIGPFTEDDKDSVHVIVPEVADLRLTKTVDNNTPVALSNITYTVTVFNDGPDDADNVHVQDLLTGGVSYVSSTPSQGTYNDGTGDWNIGTIPNGGSVTLAITAQFVGGTVNNIAEVSASDQDDPDSTPGNSIPSEDDQAEALVTNQNSDLEIVKTVSNPLPSDGDVLIFSIVIDNHGPNIAHLVEVTDVLSSGLVYISNSPSQGTYTPGTGVWAVGTINVGASATLTLTASVNLGTCASIDLGAAMGYNVFLFGDINQPSADTQGKMAVGGNAYLSAYSVGDKLPASNGTVDVLIVDGNLLFISGDVWGGNVVYGNSTNLPTNTVSVRDGTVRQDNPIDFTAAYTYLSNLSNTLSGYTQTGTVTNEWGTITMTGTHPYLNVFNITGSDFSNANSRIIDVPSGSGVLVNIDGAFINVSRGLDIKGTGVHNVLFNFYQATQINIHAVDVKGSILAPDADVNYNSGVVTGQLIANSMSGSGQFNNSLFTGDIPCGSNLTNCVTITSSDIVDLFPANDQSCAFVTVVSGVLATGDWTLLGTFPENEIIYSLSTDNSGNILAGTVGGRFYSSNNGGAVWTQVNGQLPAAYIWDIAVNSNNHIYLGTEAGIYYTTDGGSTWLTPTGSISYVRSIEIDDITGHIYVGTWGSGVYKSTNNGATWFQTNAGLGDGIVVTSLTIDDFSNIYAGTFGFGVFKSTNGGATWTNTDLPYDYVWDLDVTSSAHVYVATYGGGIYRTMNGGTTWEDLNSLLDLWYTYGVAIDASNNVFVSTWTGGVYKLTGITPFAPGGFASPTASYVWEPVGMNGVGVSTIMIDNNSKTIFVGSDKGEIYANKNLVTSINENVEVPIEYSLGQNYPNPFNPATSIKVSIKQSGSYSLKVYNVIGQEVENLFTGELEAGYFDFTFDGKALSSGIYFYKLDGKDISITKKMMLLK